VKELKFPRVAIDSAASGVWNPVKELKYEVNNAPLDGDLSTVESGEGIERLPIESLGPQRRKILGCGIR